jgi:plasmid maintenance system antidote protein VapI
MTLLAKWLESRQMSQANFARAMNYTTAYVNQLVHGRREINDAFIGRFIRTFGAEEAAVFIDDNGNSQKATTTPVVIQA